MLRTNVMKKVAVLVMGMLLICGSLAANVDGPFKANVMAPLHVKVYNNPAIEEEADWTLFEQQLGIAKSIGVDAVSVDVWWGDVEADYDITNPASPDWNWDYYQRVFSLIKAADLKIVAIMSIHQCGGNVGDDYTSPIPAWIWNKIKGTRSADDMKFKSELGNYSQEVVSLWADDRVLAQYNQFYQAFAYFCRANGFEYDLDEINISAGPAGELRYPSYNSHDWVYTDETKSTLWAMVDANDKGWRGDRTNWPYRGALQCYGALAVEDFQNKMKTKYGNSLDALKSAWGIFADGYTSFSDIVMPNSGTAFVYPDGKIFKAEDFFQSGAYYKSQYGRDLLEWYNQSLIDHGKRMINTAKTAFNSGNFASVELGIKVPGIHWQIGSLDPANQTDAPRAAEIAAGLIRLGPDFNNGYDIFSDVNNAGHGYGPIINVCKDNGREVVLHFTCLEMADNVGGNWIEVPQGSGVWKQTGQTREQYSLANSLVGWVATEAFSQGVTVKGENALSQGLMWAGEYFPAGQSWTSDWTRMQNAIDRYPYAGLTILRIGNVTTELNYDGRLSQPMPLGKIAYSEMIIQKFKKTIHFKPWDAGASYTMHCWDGYSADLDLTADSANTGWLKVVLPADAPESFKFVFKDNLGNWEGTPGQFDRLYKGREIYTMGRNGACYVTKPETITVDYKEFESAGNYGIHLWEGITGDVDMDYAGYIGGEHWWTATFEAPKYFKYCFNNSNGNWDGTNRVYVRYPQNTGASQPVTEVYARANNSVTYYADRPEAVTIYYIAYENAGKYYLNTSDGLTGSYEMALEGTIDGVKWYKVTLPTAPGSFKFWFSNTNNTSDSLKRTYAGQSGAVYAKPYDSMVYTGSRPAPNTVTIYYKEFESAANYFVHFWYGINNDFQMQFEGTITGEHWWVATIPNVPEYFKFCFRNNDNWDGVNRTYTVDKGNVIYILPNDPVIYQTR